MEILNLYKSNQYVKVAMLRKLLRSFDSKPFICHGNESCGPLWQLSYHAYKELDNRQLPYVFDVLKLKNKSKVEEARKALQEYTCLFHLENPDIDEINQLDELESDFPFNTTSSSIPAVGNGYRLDFEDVCTRN